VDNCQAIDEIAARGPVAQRLEQGTHNPFTAPQNPNKNDTFTPKHPGAAQLQRKSKSAQRTETRPV